MQDNHVSFNTILSMISNGTITEVEAERLMNAYTRMQSGVPTGKPSRNDNKPVVHGENNHQFQ